MKSDTLPELPPLPSHDEHFMTCAHVYTADQMQAYALQARAQVQGETVANVSAFGLVEWFTEPRAIGPCTLYTTPQPAQATQAEVTGCNCRWEGDAQIQWCELHLAHKEAIHDWAERAKEAEKQLALRPERVPMTEDAIDKISQGFIGKLATYQNVYDYTRSVEAHHGITAQDKKEQA